MPQHTSDAHALTSLLDYGAWNVEVGREVVAALRGLGSRAAPALVDVLLGASRLSVSRMTAAWLLGRIGGERAREALCTALDDRDHDVSTVARTSLARLGCDCRVPVAA